MEEPIKFEVRIGWKNSVTGTAAEASDGCTLPSAVTAGHRFTKTLAFPETYMFENDFDAAHDFLSALQEWGVCANYRAEGKGRIPLTRNGQPQYKDGDQIWWLATVTDNIPSLNGKPYEPFDDEGTRIEDPNIDLGRE